MLQQKDKTIFTFLDKEDIRLSVVKDLVDVQRITDSDTGIDKHCPGVRVAARSKVMLVCNICVVLMIRT